MLIEIDRDKAALASGLIENGAESALMLRAAAGNQRKDFIWIWINIQNQLP